MSTKTQHTGTRNDPRDFDMSEWDLIELNWWYRRSGDVEIHLRADSDLGWEVSQLKRGESIVNPLYIPSFDDAYSEAMRLSDFLERAIDVTQERASA